jgi:hypothetical protein
MRCEGSGVVGAGERPASSAVRKLERSQAVTAFVADRGRRHQRVHVVDLRPFSSGCLAVDVDSGAVDVEDVVSGSAGPSIIP